MPSPSESLPCLVNGHTPPDSKYLHKDRGNCTFCGQLLHRSRVWMGVKGWKIWWTPLELPKGVEVRVNPPLEEI